MNPRAQSPHLMASASSPRSPSSLCNLLHFIVRVSFSASGSPGAAQSVGEANSTAHRDEKSHRQQPKGLYPLNCCYFLSSLRERCGAQKTKGDSEGLRSGENSAENGHSIGSGKPAPRTVFGNRPYFLLPNLIYFSTQHQLLLIRLRSRGGIPVFAGKSALSRRFINLE